MSKFIKLIRKIPYKRRQLDAFCKEFDRMGDHICDENSVTNDTRTDAFYRGAQFGMVYAGYIFGDLTKEELQKYICCVIPDEKED